MLEIGKPFAAIKLRNRILAAQTGQYDPDLLIRRIPLAVSVGSDFCVTFAAPSGATMNQKSSVNNSSHVVYRMLTADNVTAFHGQ